MQIARIVLLGLALLVLVGSATPPKAFAIQRAQPVLLQMAAQKPDATIGVIVQKSVKDASVEETVARLGGTVTTDLSIINAFAAEMPAHAIQQLATTNGVKWVSLDAPMVETGGPDGTVNATALKSVYNQAIGSDKLWAEGYQGSTVTVAVVDSGVAWWNDFAQNPTGGSASRIVANYYANTTTSGNDLYGHGTHVMGIVGGNGYMSRGAYIGVAPKAKLVNVKVSDDKGIATASTVVAGLQWVLNNHSRYNIRVVNLSLNAAVAQSYNVDPLDAAVEVLWFNKIVVVVSSGNDGRNALYPPANDPFVITVGATNDRGTTSIMDDFVAVYSGGGTTSDGFNKPDLVAPGTAIVSTISGGSVLANAHPGNIVPQGANYFRMSGTSMAAPMVSGAVALLLESNPNLTPDQVKYRLKSTANKNPFVAINEKVGAGLLDIYAAVHSTTTASANTGIAASHLLWTGTTPITWNSVNWDSVNWDSVNWDSVNWNSVNWDSVNWNSDYWGN